MSDELRNERRLAGAGSTHDMNVLEPGRLAKRKRRADSPMEVMSETNPAGAEALRRNLARHSVAKKLSKGHREVNQTYKLKERQKHAGPMSRAREKIGFQLLVRGLSSRAHATCPTVLASQLTPTPTLWSTTFVAIDLSTA